MSREELHDLFTELAEDVTRAELVAPALVRADRVRRRRWAVSGAFVAVAVAAGIGALAVRPGPSPVPPVAPSVTGTTHAEPWVDRLPNPLRPEAQPLYPASIAVPANAPTLAQAPITHATMLYSPAGETRVWAYGEHAGGTFGWARLDVALVLTRDADGNQAMPLDSSSLGPMGRRAAFAQPDGLTVVDLITGEPDRIQLAGLNEDVAWLPDGVHVLVSSATDTWLVNVETRAAVPASARGVTVAPLVGGGSGLTTMSVDDDGVPRLRWYGDGGAGATNPVPLRTAPYRVDYLQPRGWRYGDQIAQAGSGGGPDWYGDFVIVVNGRSAEVMHVLDLGRGRNKGCCTVLGWPNDHQVILFTEQEGLLLWDLAGGTVRRVSRPTDGLIAVAPAGCDWSLTIAGTTRSCVP